jgi:D-tyrosyl-tRNA(Tyr) deacylase
MRAIIQRVSESSVTIDHQIHSKIGNGFLVLLGIEQNDTNEDADWLCQKITQMRIFNDENGKMNLNLEQIQGEILIVSQFTLHAATAKGNRPSFIKAARPETAIPLYEYFIKAVSVNVANVKTGIFGADMKINLTNDGPVTIFIDSKQRE